MSIRNRRAAIGLAVLGLVAGPLGCLSTGHSDGLHAENETLTTANDKLSATVEQYETDATRFEQLIFDLEQELVSMRAREAALRLEAGDLVHRVHSLEASGLAMQANDAAALPSVSSEPPAAPREETSAP